MPGPRVADVTFLVHRAERADLLVEGLAELLRVPLADPFAQELVLVPARGVERWLSQRLSHRLGHGPGSGDGVCAGVDFRSPRSLISEILGTREQDPWAPDAVVWPLLRVIDDCAGESWARVLTDHLGYGIEGEEGELRRSRRYSVAHRLARLFSSYADQRPALLDDWSTGRDTDGLDNDLSPDLRWQAELWRRLLDQVKAPGPTERHRAVVTAVRAGQHLDLPPRLSLFGHTRLSQTDAELLAALGEHHDVHLWLPHPSDVLWQGLVGDVVTRLRRDDTSHALIDNPLLASMSRDIREMQGVLERVGAVDAGALVGPSRGDSLLSVMQTDIAASRSPRRDHRGDASVQVHACHGPARQVEVLREVLLGLLQDDPTLQPRDILVMCPDIEAYAPLLTAAFGTGDAVAGAHPGHGLRVQLADRSPAQTNPLLDVVAKILDLADGRVEATRVLDLLATEPVSRRFGFFENDFETINRWIADAGIRWAWDEDGREAFGLGKVVQNTWRFGLDRVLAGVALSDDSRIYVDRALPLDDVSSTSIALAGRLAEAIDRLRSLTIELTGSHPVSHWLTTISDGLGDLAEPAHGEEWQVAQVHRELASMTAAATGDTELVLRLGDVRSMLHSQLGGRPTRANFRTGTLTICTLTPMRSVPHRVVCLLGIDDQVFPRSSSVDGDDVLGRDPVVGERDVRAQDRQLFLDAVIAAEETLVITYTGFNESTGETRPPSVPLREFIDAAAMTAPGYDGLVRAHHSQFFHVDYLRGDTPFSFDRQAPAAARATLTERQAPPALLDLRLARPEEDEILLDDLRETLTDPVRSFLKHRLGVRLPRAEDELSDAIPIEVGGLEEWAVGERLLRETLEGRPVPEIRSREWRRGTLPPGQLGVATMRRVAQSVQPLASEFESTTQGRTARQVDIDVQLPDRRRVVGTVGGVYENRIVRVSYSRLKGKQRIEAFLFQAAAAATHSTGLWVARSIGRHESPAAGAGAILTVTNDLIAEPLVALAELVAIRDAMLMRPVPLMPNTSWTDVSFRGSSYEKNDELRKVWGSECRAPEMQLLFGHRPTLAEAQELLDDDSQPLLRTLGRRLWAPIRRVERR